ncbi:hypothetical protein [Lactiplantibacillus plantarum]|uniref:hypothetical protein n=1 Tax=Lactiplantibacillus plantarum TaxID=1590 RepID=UPI003F52D6B5
MDKVIRFNRFEIGVNKVVNLPETLEMIYNNFRAKKYNLIPEMDINIYHLYVAGIEKFPLDDDIDTEERTAIHRFAYVLNISNVQPGADINYADIELPVDERAKKVDKNKVLDKSEHEDKVGPLTNTQVVLDPSRRIVGTCSGQGRLNKWFITKLLKELLKTHAMKLNVILDKQGIEDIKNLEITNSIEYAISSPDNFKEYKDVNSTERADLAFANYFNGNKVSLLISSENMPKRKVLKKVKSLLSDDYIRKVKVTGMEDGVESIVDPIKHKLAYVGKVTDTGAPTTKDYVNFLRYGYLQVYPFIKATYNADPQIEIKN